MKIFLYFEEDDLCKRGNIKKYYSYKTNKVIIDHNIGTSVTNIKKVEQNRLKETHFGILFGQIFYFHSKYYGKLLSIIIFIPTFVKIIFKILKKT